MISLAKRLNKIGVLGINRRNAEFMLPYNQRRLYPLVDDKLRTKQLAEDAGIAVPKLYAVIEAPHQVAKIGSLLAPYQDCVIKPSMGSGGDGILVFAGRSKELYRTVGGHLMDEEALKYHINNLLSGSFSLGGQPDKALIEYRVKFDPVFEKIAYQGVPDVRIIVFLGVPVMAMVRLPTRMSGGKANLHQGAIGAGIDLATGLTLKAVWRNSIINEHPDTGFPVMGVKIPNWEELLVLGARSYELTGLGYQGIDIVLDEELGPLILEMNARPGLNIQIANGTGLGRRLEMVRSSDIVGADVAARVQFAKSHFATDDEVHTG